MINLYLWDYDTVVGKKHVFMNEIILNFQRATEGGERVPAEDASTHAQTDEPGQGGEDGFSSTETHGD